VVQRLPSGTRKIVQRGGYYGRYLPSGLGSPKRAERENLGTRTAIRSSSAPISVSIAPLTSQCYGRPVRANKVALSADASARYRKR